MTHRKIQRCSYNFLKHSCKKHFSWVTDNSRGRATNRVDQHFCCRSNCQRSNLNISDPLSGHVSPQKLTIGLNRRRYQMLHAWEFVFSVRYRPPVFTAPGGISVIHVQPGCIGSTSVLTNIDYSKAFRLWCKFKVSWEENRLLALAGKKELATVRRYRSVIRKVGVKRVRAGSI